MIIERILLYFELADASPSFGWIASPNSDGPSRGNPGISAYDGVSCNVFLEIIFLTIKLFYSFQIDCPSISIKAGNNPT